MNRRHATTVTVVTTFVLLVAAVCDAQAAGKQPPKDSRSDLIRSMAEFGRARCDNIKAVASFLTSMAQIEKTREETRTIKLGNDQKAVEVYFERKRINRKYRAEFHKRTMDTAKATQLAQQGLPGRLKANFVSFVSLNASPSWPYALTGDDYQEFRQQVEMAWVDRSSVNSNRGTRCCHEIQSAAAKMRQVLARHVHDMPPMEWIHANQFLKSLAYEAEQPADKPSNLLASR